MPEGDGTVLDNSLVSPPSASINSSTVHQYAVSNDGKRFLIRETTNAGATEVEPLYLNPELAGAAGEVKAARRDSAYQIIV